MEKITEYLWEAGFDLAKILSFLYPFPLGASTFLD